MSDFVTAINEHIPQLQIYSLAAKDLQAWVDNNKKVHREIEDNVEKVMPGLFREFSSANEDERSALLVCTPEQFVHFMLILMLSIYSIN